MKFINLGVLAHVDAGKTTTVEQMLYYQKEVKAPGSVEKGNTKTDFLAIERERGISVKSSSVQLLVNDIKINIIDTPGHIDFTGEVERALSVLDGVVLVISSAEGIQSQTERFFEAIKTLKIPTVIFLNKIDRFGCEPLNVLESLKKEFSRGIIPLNNPVDYGTNDCKVVACDFSEDSILDICDLDDNIASKYLEGEELTKQEIVDSLMKLTKECKAFPLYFGAASMGIGIDMLMDGITKYLPFVSASDDGDLSGIIYKIEHDNVMGKIAHVRLYEGFIKNRDNLALFRNGSEPFNEKVTQIRAVSGSKMEDSGILKAGDIGAVYGLSNAKTGDMIGRLLERKQFQMAVPLLLVQVFSNNGDPMKLLKAISELSDEDPLLEYEWDADEREIVIKIMGDIQLEVLSYLLKERYNLDVTFSPPSVIYKETPEKPGIGFEAYTMPKPCWAVVKLQIDPAPQGSGYHFESLIKENVLPGRYQNHVEQCIPETLKQGLSGWEVTDLNIKLIDGEHHTVHTHAMDFFVATPVAVMNGLENCGTSLLEPFVKMRLIADESLSGKLIGDILSMRGEFDSPVMISGKVHIEALVPVATSMDYSIKFSSLTSGHGIIKSEFFGYKKCPAEIGIGKTRKRRGVNPLDRAKWILFKRSAIK